MLWCVMEHDLMSGITQKCGSAHHRGENAAFAFDPQICIEPTALCDETDQRFGLMDVEVVTDKMPTGHVGIGSHHRLDMDQKIGLGPRGSCIGSHYLSCDHISTDDEGARPMANVLKFASLHFSGSQRQSWVFAFQCLDSGQFIGAHRPFSLFDQVASLSIDLADLPNDFFAMRINWWGQPIADQMRFEIPFFNTRAACRGEICSTMPRAITSSAISRPVHWLIGRSFGCSQASATIWQVCSAVMWDGFPGRGISSRRSLTESSSCDTACKPIQRVRQLRTVSTQTFSSLAIWLLFLPSAAARIIRPRRAICWGVLCRRTSAPSSFCSCSLNVNASGLGPRMLSVLLCSSGPILLQNYFSRNVLETKVILMKTMPSLWNAL